MNFNDIKDTVGKEYATISEYACDCDGKFQMESQALCYSEEEKAMVDVISCKCDGCGKEKSFRFPIKSAYGQMMAGFMQKVADLKAQGLSMYSGHTVLEGSYCDENDHFKKEPFTLKCQCYRCDTIFEYHYVDDGTYHPCACPKCDAS